MTLDTAVSMAGAVLLAALIAIFVKRRIVRALPVFFCYLLFGFCVALAAALTQRLFPHFYLREWIAEACLDPLFYFCALVELQRSLARHNRALLPGWQFFTMLVVLNGALLERLLKWTIPFHYSAPWQFAVHTMQATATLELAGLLALVEWSVFRGFHWPDREFRIVSGFGFSAVVTMAAAILYSYRFTYTDGRFPWINLLGPITALGVLIYWVYSFLFENRGMADRGATKGQWIATGSGNGRNGESFRAIACAIDGPGIDPN